MNIGFVSTWLHRGAAYVTIGYAKMLMPEHNIFVYARGGEYFDSSFREDGISIYEGLHAKSSDGIIMSDFRKWISSNAIDIIIWNEQRDLSFVCEARRMFPKLIQGSYIDYYREDTVAGFAVFDFLLCNTKRHYSVFKWHPYCYYLPWGCDTELYRPFQREADGNNVVFFHSMGMADRKGTDVLIKTFVKNRLWERGAKLVIHTQIGVQSLISGDETKRANIQIVEGTVTAPGLYKMGDVYVYPAKLDGLGLTMYEAVSSGLPVIAPDAAPMNEIVNERCGRLVSVKKTYCRSDGYYWPLTDVDENSLLDALNFYIDNYQQLEKFKNDARGEALSYWNLKDRKPSMLEIISAVRRNINDKAVSDYMKNYKAAARKRKRREFIDLFVPEKLYSVLVKSEKSR